MNNKTEYIVKENYVDTTEGRKYHPYSKWGVYEIIYNSDGEQVGGPTPICMIPDFHLDPKATGQAIIDSLNKSGIRPVTYERLT